MSRAPAAPIQINALPAAVWQRVSDLFDQVIELDETERVGFVRNVWAREPEVAQELMELLMSAAKLEKKPPVAQAPFDAVLGQALSASRASASTNAYVEGQKFGAWTLETRLGQGGMGEVWRAKRSDGMYKASAALKLLRSDIPSEKLSARFKRERVVLARLNHPNIARLLDAGVENDQAFIVLELVEGTQLLEYVVQHAPTLADRIRLVRDVAIAVEHAHSQRVLHRDLKPSNVLVTASGQVKLLDFGIAGVLDDANDEPMTKLTQLTGRGLTLEYASPEQIAGDATAATSDVYSLGVLAFHLCTGNRPFAGSSTRAALEYSMVNSDPPLASHSIAKAGAPPVAVDQIAAPVDAMQLTGELDTIIQRAMRRAPSDRYPTAAAFAAALGTWVSPRQPTIEVQSSGTPSWLPKNWNTTALIAASTLAIITVLGLSLWQRHTALNTAEAAVRQLDRVMSQLPMGTASITADSDTIIDLKLQHVALLMHNERPSGALRAIDELTPTIIAKHGRNSASYGKLLLLRADALVAMHRLEDAKAAEADALKLGVKR
jgi:eukaryotic-like serine/threonine-protein kinase